jgi:hypothetical protein
MVASPAQAANSDFLTIADAGNWEGQNVTFKLTYTGASSATFTIGLSYPGGAGTAAGTDFNLMTPLTSDYFASGTTRITFPASSANSPSTATVNAASLDDGDTDDEYFNLTAAPFAPDTGPTKTGAGTIWALPVLAPVVTFTAPSTVAESAGSVAVTANLSSPATHDVTIPVETTVSSPDHTGADAAVSTGGVNRDYTALPANSMISIPAGQLNGSISVPINDDNVYEGMVQYFRVDTPTTLTGAVSGTPSADIGITDNDSMPSVSIADAPAVTEGGNSVFPITLSALSESDTVVTFTTSNGVDTGTTHGATTPGDYTGGTASITIPKYNKTINVPIATATDTVVEGPETFKATVSLPPGTTNATLGSPATATATINDGSTLPAITLDTDAVTGGFQTHFAEGRSGEVNTFITVAGTASGTQQVPLEIDYSFAGGTATNGVDYRGTSGTLTVPVGATTFTAQIPVTIIGDTLYEGTGETFDVVLASANNTINPSSLGHKPITIDEAGDDVPPTWTTQDISIAEGNSGQTMAQVPVKLSAPTSQDVTFDATFTGTPTATEGGVNSGATSGANDFDYPTVSAVTVPAGSSVGYLQVPINGDTVFEKDESFNVTFAAGNNSAFVDSTPSNDLLRISRVVITNDDAAPTMSFNEASGTEGTSLQIKGTVVGVAQSAYTLKFSTAGLGTAPNAATLVDDYDSAAVTAIAPVTVTQGQTGALIGSLATVFLSSDSIDEPTESFGITAYEVTPVPAGFKTSTGVFKITDDPGDLPPAVSVHDETIKEGEGSVDVQVDLAFTGDTTATTQTVTVPYFTQDGSAKVGQDYTETKGTLSFAPGEMSKMINVPIKKDGVKEANEDFYVKLGTPGPAGAVITKGAGDVIILANDGGSGGPTPPSNGGPSIMAPAWVTGSVAVPVTGKADPGATVDLWGGPWSPAMPKLMKIDSVKADSSGNYKFARWIGTGYRFQTAVGDKMSDEVKVGIAQAPVFLASSPSKGKLSLAIQGNPRGPKQVVIVQVWSGGKWVNTWRGTTVSNNLWKATVSEKSKSSWTLRAFVQGDMNVGINGGYSAAKKVTIK